jgi:hypothetical protein
MNPPRQIKGFWWFPEQPETPWFGTLTLASEHGPKLEVFHEGGELSSQERAPSGVHPRDAEYMRAREKSKFLSAKVKSCWSEGESPSGLAESRRSLERKN